MLIQLLPLNKAPKTTHAPARGQNTGQQQMKQTSNTGGKLQTALVAGGNFLDTVNTTVKAITNIESLSKTFHDVTGDKGITTEGNALPVELFDDGVGTAEQELGNNSLDVEDHEYADGELEGDDNNDQELYCGQGDDEIAAGVGVDGEDEWEGADYGDPEQEDEYACSELGVDDEGDQEVYYPSEDEYNGGEQEAYLDYEDQGQEHEYDGDYPQDGGIQDACYPQDGGIQDAFYPQDGGILDAYCPQDGDDGGVLTDLVDGDNGGILTDLVDAIFNWSN